jgi:ribosome-associated protein
MARRTRKTLSAPSPARQLAIEAAGIAHDHNATNVVVLDLRGVSPVTEYFVICTGTSDRQMRTVADEIARHGARIGQRVWQIAGQRSAEWIVMDFVDVVVHIFDEVHRRYYDLELIWGEAPRVRWREALRRRRARAK